MEETSVKLFRTAELNSLLLFYAGSSSQSKARIVLDRSYTGLVGSNPARGMTLCCAVLRRWRLWDGSIPHQKNSTKMFKWLHSFRH